MLGFFSLFAKWLTTGGLQDGTCVCSSGILPSQYERFCNMVQFGHFTTYMQEKLRKTYSEMVGKEAQDSCEQALLVELGYDIPDDETEETNTDNFQHVSMITDARHGWRRNSRQTDVVAIGVETHKVLRLEVVTKVEEVISQRHELTGTRRLYEYFDSVFDGVGVGMKVHAHDRNASINNFVKREYPETVNQNDTWHVAKREEKQAKPIVGGPAATHGKYGMKTFGINYTLLELMYTGL